MNQSVNQLNFRELFELRGLLAPQASAAGTGGLGGGSPPAIVTYTIPTLHSLRHQPYQILHVLDILMIKLYIIDNK